MNDRPFQTSHHTEQLDTRIILNFNNQLHSYGKIGEYELYGLLGHGATSVVYRARGKDGKDYALKIFTYQGDGVARECQRFFREIESLKRFRHHPNIIKIHEAGQHGNQFYIVMDLLPGITLNRIIEEQAPIHPERTLRIILQLADAIHCMHNAGYVHRDLKPSNVMLLPGDFPVLMDFGLVQVANSDLTLPGSILGTPGYMAPEQFLQGSRDLHFTADIYSLGIICYKLLTGYFPFPIVETMSLGQLFQTLKDSEPIPCIQYGVEISPVFERIIHKMIAFHPEDRYQRLSEWRKDVEAMQQGIQLRISSPGVGKRLWRWAKWYPHWAITMLLTTIIFGSAWIFYLYHEKQNRLQNRIVFQKFLQTQIPSGYFPETLSLELEKQWSHFQQLINTNRWLLALETAENGINWAQTYQLNYVRKIWKIHYARVLMVIGRYPAARDSFLMLAQEKQFSPEIRFLCYFEGGIAEWLRGRKKEAKQIWNEANNRLEDFLSPNIQTFFLGLTKQIQGETFEFPYPISSYPEAIQALFYWVQAQNHPNPKEREKFFNLAKVLGGNIFYWIHVKKEGD